MLRRNVKYDHVQKEPPFYISKDLAYLLKELLVNGCELKSVRRGLDGPYGRTVQANTKYGSFQLRDDWHQDSYDSITIIVPLTKFTEKNGSTQLILPAPRGIPLSDTYNHNEHIDQEIVHFIGATYQPLIMNRMTFHRQSENITDTDRDSAGVYDDALIIQIDRDSAGVYDDALIKIL